MGMIRCNADWTHRMAEAQPFFYVDGKGSVQQTILRDGEKCPVPQCPGKLEKHSDDQEKGG